MIKNKAPMNLFGFRKVEVTDTGEMRFIRRRVLRTQILKK
jgi:hypothetical protein